jgi:hypothetical protein
MMLKRELVPLGQRSEAGWHRLKRFVGVRVGLVEDQEVATRLQRPRDGVKHCRLQIGSDLVHDEEAGGDVVDIVLAQLVPVHRPDLAPV